MPAATIKRVGAHRRLSAAAHPAGGASAKELAPKLAPDTVPSPGIEQDALHRADAVNHCKNTLIVTGRDEAVWPQSVC